MRASNPEADYAAWSAEVGATLLDVGLRLLARGGMPYRCNSGHTFKRMTCILHCRYTAWRTSHVRCKSSPCRAIP
jgi:hypothetical protein